MRRGISFIRLTSKGREEYMKAGDYFAQVMEIVGSFGGKLDGVWALSAGPIDFVSVTTYPDEVAALKARLRLEGLGVVTIESYPITEMPEYLQAAAD